MQQVIIYKARPESVLKILGLLRQAGLNPVALDNPDGTQQAYAAFNYLVRIAIPKDESQEARAVLEQWEKEVKPEVDKLSRQFSRQWLYVLLGFGVIWAAVAFSGVWLMSEIMMVLGLLILLLYPFVYIYNKWKRRHEAGLSPDDHEKDTGEHIDGACL